MVWLSPTIAREARFGSSRALALDEAHHSPPSKKKPCPQGYRATVYDVEVCERERGRGEERGVESDLL